MGQFAGGKLQTLAVLLALLTTAVVSLYFRDIENENALKDFEVLATEGTDALDARLHQYMVGLEGLGGLFDVTGTPDRKTVETYVASLQLDELLPGINGIGFIEYVPADQLDRFLDESAELGIEDITVYPPSDRDVRFVIKYIEPYVGNEEALGLDISFEEGRRTAALAARDTGLPHLTPRILLVQDDSKTPGFLLLRPYYAPEAEIETVEQRRAAFKGWVYAPFIGARTLENLTPSQNQAYRFSVYDGEATEPDMLIFDSAAGEQKTHTSFFTTQSQLEIYGRTWTIKWESLPEFEAAKRSNGYIFVMVFGLLLTGLLYALLQNLSQRQKTVEQIVRRKTLDLEAQKIQNESILNNPLLAIMITDAHGKILRRNDASNQILELGRDYVPNLLTVVPELTGMEGGTRTRLEFQGKDSVKILSVKKNDWTTPHGEKRSTYFLRDITAAEATSAAAINAEKRLDLALQASEIGVFEIDLATGESIVSDMWMHIMNVPDCTKDFDAQAYFEACVDPDDYRILQANDSACIQGKEERTTTEFRVHLDNGTRWMRSDAFVSSRDASGRALKLVGTQIDITASREMDRVKNEFIATVSHELRTPITAVKGAIGLLKASPDLSLPAPSARLLDIAQTNVDRLTELVNDILDLERVQAGHMRLEYKDIAVNTLLRDAREQILPIAKTANIDVDIQPADNDPVLPMDRSRMLQIMANLLSNACKFAPAGTTIQVGADTVGSQVRIYVRDAGPGVPKSFVPSLFKPFSQADNSDTREKSGTGLGLCIAREIIERMSGQIGYRKTDDNMTEFWVSLTMPESFSSEKQALRLVQ